VIAATLLLASMPGLAAAAAPSNDLPAGAIAITSVPTSIALDTTEATVTTDNVGCGSDGTDQATVWYTLTLAQATRVAVDASASSYAVGINLFAGSASADNLVDCLEQTLVFDADAGTTYYLMFADIDGDANGGQLNFSLDVAPPPIEVDVTVDGTAKVNAKTGEALVGGTITCSTQTSDAFVDVELRQPVGRFTIHGFGGAQAECGPTPTQWWASITGENGKFSAGKATVVANAFACDAFGCGDASLTASVRLRR
jgi:hypothetical protein